MGIFQQFPYSNFHEMNLDQIIKIMRQMQDEWEATKTEWASYKEFIDNYFENLNLDEETEKALRVLVADGTLDSVIDPVIAAEVAAWLAAHITPTTPAIDDTLTVEGAAADAKATGDAINDLRTDLRSYFKIDDNVRPNLTLGKFINANTGAIEDGNAFALTAPMPIYKGQTISLTATGYLTTLGMIATCNSDNTQRTVVAKSIDTTERTYTYTAEEDGYVVCSFGKNDPWKISFTIDYYNYLALADTLTPIFRGTKNVTIIPILNGFINASNSQYNANNAFRVSDSAPLYKGQTVYLTATGYLTNVGMINLYDVDNDAYQTVVASIDTTERTYTYTAPKDCIIRFSYGKNNPVSAVIVTSETASVRLNNIESAIEDLSNNETRPIEYPQFFDNVLCIGDSLTIGYDGGDDPLTKNYPHFISKLMVAETAIKAHGGWTAKQVWDNIISSAADLANYDCAIIFLGTNGGLTDTVNTDCNVDYTQNADTNTGCYGKIIGKIKSVAPNCRIFCVAGVNDYVRRATTMNPAVRALASFYNVGLIDVEDCIMSDDGSDSSAERYLYRPIDGIHYNALGYMTLSNMFYDSMRDFMSDHRTMYDDYNNN